MALSAAAAFGLLLSWFALDPAALAASAASCSRIGTAARSALRSRSTVVPPAAEDERKGKPKRPATADPSAVVEGAAGQELDEFMQSAQHFPEGFNGCVLVAKEGAVLLAKGYGVAKADPPTPMRADALWDWCSVSKQFTAAAVLKLEMQKKLKLDDPLKKFWKDAPKDKQAITVRQLLNHTSGLPTAPELDRAKLFDRDATAQGILAAPVVREPGKKWEYNNAAYFLLAALIERVSGESFEAYCRTNLFAPAGMKEAGFIGDGKADHARAPGDARGTKPPFAYGERMSWGYRGAGGALASVFDMLAWDEALRSDKLLSKAAKAQYYAVGLENYALGWEVTKGAGGLRAAHSGHTGNLVTYYLRLLDERVVIAIAYSYEPKTHPSITVEELLRIARSAKGK